jgi:hypothetical protein
MSNRGVEIDHDTIKNWTPWFYVTNALRQNIMIVWANRACLSVSVNFARKIPKSSIMLCPNQ